jgi:hypothetical protein
LHHTEVPIETTLDHEGRLVSFRVTGALDTKEMLDAVEKTFGQRKPGVVYNVLSDTRAVAVPATPDQIKSLVAELARHGTVDGMRAALVVGTDASYGMMRMMSAYTEPLGIHVGIFRDTDAARAFLDAD